MEKWFVETKKADFDRWAAEFHISPVLARILRNRDLTEESEIRKFLYGTLEDCYSPRLLKDMDKAVSLIVEMIEKGGLIRVIGDYDVDGICASYILTEGLRILGGRVDTAIPHRIHDGYGLNQNLIEEAREDGIRMIVTCDNGIAAKSQIELANSYGIQVIVTDHHEVFSVTDERTGRKKEVLPPALALIDPKQEACTYPFKDICGAGVAYKLIQALTEKTGSGKLKEAEEEFLEFVAFATVCDVMELRDENRIFVKEGLKRLRRTRNPGLLALMEVNQIEPAKLNVHHLGFVLGPCLNASGRLDTAGRALEMLQSRTKAEAAVTAGELKSLNESRKELTKRGLEEAIRYIEENGMDQDKVMIVFLPEVHESLAGIIAGRVREQYNHPVFILTRGESGVKGSGRSIEGYHMQNAMAEVSHLFTNFGGHAMAGGLSMREEDIETLRREMNARCRLKPEDFVEKVRIDVPLPFLYGTEELAKELELLEPFGVGNPTPLFAQKKLVFLSGVRMGANKNFGRYRVRTPEGAKVQLVFFGNLDRFSVFLDEKYGAGSGAALYDREVEYELSVAYRLGINTYRGNTEVQYIMQHYC